jgi:hypothetical protein
MKINLKNPRTIQDYAVKIFCEKAKAASDWSEFWCDLMNYGHGNVRQLVLVFEWAGVSTKDISKAYNQLRKL